MTVQPMTIPELKHLFRQAQKGAQLRKPKTRKLQSFEQKDLESLGTWEENDRMKLIQEKCRWVQLRQNSVQDWKAVKINNLQKTLHRKKYHGKRSRAAVE